MSDYYDFFLNSSQEVLPLECLEISHPSFDTFYYCGQISRVTGFVHGDLTQHKYTPKVLLIDRGNVAADLDQSIGVTIGDVDSDFIQKFADIKESAFPDVRPKVTKRLYRDDMLTSPIIEQPPLEIKNITKDASGNATFQALAPELNSAKTGEVYTLERFPLLKGIIYA